MLDIEDGHVRFHYEDSRGDSSPKQKTLSATEFIRRFLLHVLPAGFHRIRYYGWLGSRVRHEGLRRPDVARVEPLLPLGAEWDRASQNCGN